MKNLEEWLHNIVHFFITLAVLALLVFTIALYARLQTQINEVDSELDTLYQVITVGAEAPQESL